MSFKLTEKDLQDIQLVKCKDNYNLWKDDDLEDLRKRIKDYFLDLPELACCYCNRNFKGEFRMVIDIEHILPKGKFKDLTYEPLNLNISCKRCNMQYKNENTDFIIDETAMGTDYFKSNHYKIIHPNLDTYLKHLNLNVYQYGKNKYTKYRVIENSSKGHFTYNYFNLKDFEIENINRAQGGNIINLSDKIKTQIRQILFVLLTKI
ncbi:HNH endonuclease [Flavobacterium rhizosphaerae]|uniref:HNH endonuclease n=1 Tax=Flavobacterium rhizosphaerae TaxID=3163298 RepID=A0ABW8YWN6_9FLAO